MSESFYITTPIYYVNDVPHLGHAYTTIAADALARFHRSRGQDTWMLTGTDEHGQKIQDAAIARNMTPIDLADEVVERFRETWANLEIAHDDFIRTTELRHKEVVQEIWQRMEAAGDIYLDAYRGWYCVSCEAYYPEAQLLADKTCPVHTETPARWVEEPSYFFKLSEYQQPLLDYIASHPEFIRPEGYRNEVVSFLKSGLRDLSISRTTFNWGIEVPGAPEHVMYVWIDALSNYISALGPLDGELNRRFWPVTCHLIGKDILRFHAVYWPCMLMSAGLPLPRCVFAHGWWTVKGKKIAKSMPATRVDPNQLAADIGADALRYFLLREVPLGLDGDFSYESLIGRYNSELANDLGNLLNRATAMTAKYFDGEIPDYSSELAAAGPHAELAAAASAAVSAAAAAYEDFAPSRALEEIWALVRQANRYVDSCQPWQLAKQAERRGELGHVMRATLEALACAARMVAPVMPRKAVEILERMGVAAEEARSLAAGWPEAALGAGLGGGGRLSRGEALFPRIDDDGAAALLGRWLPPEAAAAAAEGADAAAPAAEARPTVSFADFQRFDFRVAAVLEAEPIPKTSKLLRVVLDVGGERRQVVAGIAEAYRPEELVGHKVIFLANLEPATIRGVESEGMILAAGDRHILGLSALDRDVPAGTIVR
jgi:methionyl-tRNA synthetase